MKIAFIPPISYIHYTSKTNYQLCLPHLMSSTQYFNRYLNLCNNPDQFVILDNGAAENSLQSTEVLMSLATRLGVDEVVIPDVMGDKDATIEKAFRFFDDVVPPQEFSPLRFSFMFVVQGQTFEEVIACASWANDQSWIHTLGIPRHLLTTLSDPMARVRVANTIQSMKRAKPIHFLGGNPQFPTEIDVLADPKQTNQELVRGMDTSMPFNYAYVGEFINDPAVPVINRPDGYFNKRSDTFNEDALIKNTQFFLQYHDEGVKAK